MNQALSELVTTQETKIINSNLLEKQVHLLMRQRLTNGDEKLTKLSLADFTFTKKVSSVPTILKQCTPLSSWSNICINLRKSPSCCSGLGKALAASLVNWLKSSSPAK